MDSLVKFINSPFQHFVDVVYTHPTTQKLIKVQKKLLLNDQSLAIIEKLQQQYPGPLELQVYKSNGSSFKRISDFPSVSSSPMTNYPTYDQEEDSYLGTISSNASHFQNQPARQPHARQARESATHAAGSNALANYIIAEKNERLREKDELIKDQKDEIKILKAELQKQKEAAWDNEKALKLKDKEHELDKYSQELQSSKGLNGVIDRITEKPELLMGIMQMVTMFSGKPMPQLGLAQSQPSSDFAQPGATNNNFSFALSITADHQAVIDQIVTYLQNSTEEVAAKFYAIFLQLSQNPYNLQRTLEFLKN